MPDLFSLGVIQRIDAANAETLQCKRTRKVDRMATVENMDENRWVVHMDSPSDSHIVVEVNMSPETAKNITERETQRIAALNPGRDDIDPQTVGSAVMSVLDLFATGARL